MLKRLMVSMKNSFLGRLIREYINARYENIVSIKDVSLLMDGQRLDGARVTLHLVGEPQEDTLTLMGLRFHGCGDHIAVSADVIDASREWMKGAIEKALEQVKLDMKHESALRSIGAVFSGER